MRTFFLIISTLFAGSAFAASADVHFHALGQLPVNYFDTGAVCEQVAKQELMKSYPEPGFEVVTGISYGHKAATVGELDVIVFANSTKKAILIAEVKCWNKLAKAHAKAVAQRQRFLEALQRLPNMILHSKTQAYSVTQFQDIERFISISQLGGEENGFEMTLPYSLEDLMNLREKLLQCQNQHLCAQP